MFWSSAIDCEWVWVGLDLRKFPIIRFINKPKIKGKYKLVGVVVVCRKLGCESAPFRTVFASGHSSWWAHSMGMQSLRLKLRKRKYKLNLGGANANGGFGHGATAFSNAGSEWEFENFSPWIFTRRPVDADDGHLPVHQHFKEMDEEDERYWGPRPLIQGLVRPPVPHRAHPNAPPPIQQQLQHPQSPPPLAEVQRDQNESEQRYGILSYFPRRPSSWSPTSTMPPPVPPHAWQLRRQRPAETGNDQPPHPRPHNYRHDNQQHEHHRLEEAGATTSSSSRNPRRKASTSNDGRVVSMSSSQVDLRRSASCYQDATRGPSGGNYRMSETDLRQTGLRNGEVDSESGDEDGYYFGSNARSTRQHPFSRPPSTVTVVAVPGSIKSSDAVVSTTTSAGRLKRVQSELARGKQPQPIYSQPIRRNGAVGGGANLRPFHNGLKSTLASSESNLSGSYTLISDDIDRRPSLNPTVTSSTSSTAHRSTIDWKASGRSLVKSPSPPPVPAHAPGVLCTRIVSACDTVCNGATSDIQPELEGTQCITERKDAMLETKANALSLFFLPEYKILFLYQRLNSWGKT